MNLTLCSLQPLAPRWWVPLLLILMTGCGGARHVVRLETGQGPPTLFTPRTASAEAVKQASGVAYSGFRKAMGSPGEGKEWHHLVEQTPGNVERFGAEAIHNTENIIPLDKGLHSRVSGFYSSIAQEVTGTRTLTVRKWLSTQSYETQRRFALEAIDKVLKGLWGARK